MACEQDRGFEELLARYEFWRKIALNTGLLAVDEPTWEAGRLFLREGYPYDGWTGYVVDQESDGYRVSMISTERQVDPVENPVVFCSDVEEAGKYVVWKVGSATRIALKLPSIVRDWRAAGLDPRVRQISEGQYVSRYELIEDPDRFFTTLRSGGVQPENHLLPISYDELNEVLLEGLPVHITEAK